MMAILQSMMNVEIGIGNPRQGEFVAVHQVYIFHNDMPIFFPTKNIHADIPVFIFVASFSVVGSCIVVYCILQYRLQYFAIYVMFQLSTSTYFFFIKVKI